MKKYNFTDGTFAIEYPTKKVFEMIEKIHPELLIGTGRKKPTKMVLDCGNRYIYCDKTMWQCGFDYVTSFRIKTITAEEYLGQFEEKLTVPKGIIIGKGKTHGGYPLAREDLSNTNFDSNLGLSAEDIVEIDSDGHEYTADDLRRIDKAVKYFSKDKEELTYEKLLKCDGMKCSFTCEGKFIKDAVICVEGIEIHICQNFIGDTYNSIRARSYGYVYDCLYCDCQGFLDGYNDTICKTKTQSGIQNLKLIEEKEDTMENETITVEKKVYDIMQKNSLDKIETQHENKMLKQKIAELEKIHEKLDEKQFDDLTDYEQGIKDILNYILDKEDGFVDRFWEDRITKINPETGQYLELPEDGTIASYLSFQDGKMTIEHSKRWWGYDLRLLKQGLIFDTKESCEKMAKKIRELLKGEEL